MTCTVNETSTFSIRSACVYRSLTVSLSFTVWLSPLRHAHRMGIRKLDIMPAVNPLPRPLENYHRTIIDLRFMLL